MKLAKMRKTERDIDEPLLDDDNAVHKFGNCNFVYRFLNKNDYDSFQIFYEGRWINAEYDSFTIKTVGCQTIKGFLKRFGVVIPETKIVETIKTEKNHIYVMYNNVIYSVQYDNAKFTKKDEIIMHALLDNFELTYFL